MQLPRANHGCQCRVGLYLLADGAILAVKQLPLQVAAHISCVDGHNFFTNSTIFCFVASVFCSSILAAT
jgi:hypothetical protein